MQNQRVMKRTSKKIFELKCFELNNLKAINGGLMEAISDNDEPIDPVKRPTGGGTTGSDRP